MNHLEQAIALLKRCQDVLEGNLAIDIDVFLDEVVTSHRPVEGTGTQPTKTDSRSHPTKQPPEESANLGPSTKSSSGGSLPRHTEWCVLRVNPEKCICDCWTWVGGLE